MNTYTSAHSVQAVKLGPIRTLEGGGYYREVRIEGKDGFFEVSMHADSPEKLHVQMNNGQPGNPAQARRVRSHGIV